MSFRYGVSPLPTIPNVRGGIDSSNFQNMIDSLLEERDSSPKWDKYPLTSYFGSVSSLLRGASALRNVDSKDPSSVLSGSVESIGAFISAILPFIMV